MNGLLVNYCFPDNVKTVLVQKVVVLCSLRQHFSLYFYYLDNISFSTTLQRVNSLKPHKKNGLSSGWSARTAKNENSQERPFIHLLLIYLAILYPTPFHHHLIQLHVNLVIAEGGFGLNKNLIMQCLYDQHFRAGWQLIIYV